MDMFSEDVSVKDDSDRAAFSNVMDCSFQLLSEEPNDFKILYKFIPASLKHNERFAELTIASGGILERSKKRRIGADITLESIVRITSDTVTVLLVIQENELSKTKRKLPV
jgi:hypothetical protein